MLTTQHLAIHAFDKVLLDDITISIEPTKLYGLIGHNGSGKSTLIKALSGETRPSKGTIYIDGDDLTKLSPKLLAKKLAYLPQKLPDQSGFSVEELVMLGRYPHQRFLAKPSDTDRQIVAESMAETGVSQFAKGSLATLSGGEKARAWLSMCLAQKTPYLLLDEPLAPLDIVYQVQILKLIQDLAHNKGLGVVIIIHDINLASQFCDEIIALKGGKLCYLGDSNGLMKQETLHEIFGIDLHLFTHPQTGKKVAVV